MPLFPKYNDVTIYITVTLNGVSEMTWEDVDTKYYAVSYKALWHTEMLTSAGGKGLEPRKGHRGTTVLPLNTKTVNT